MKIVNSKQHTMERFFAIGIGTVFTLNDGKCYMKIDDIKVHDPEVRAPFVVYNAICLNDGTICDLFDSQTVILVDCELIIK